MDEMTAEQRFDLLHLMWKNYSACLAAQRSMLRGTRRAIRRLERGQTVRPAVLLALLHEAESLLFEEVDNLRITVGEMAEGLKGDRISH